MSDQADEDDRYEATFNLRLHYETVTAAIPPGQQSHFDLIIETERKATLSAPTIEAAFVSSTERVQMLLRYCANLELGKGIWRG